MLPVYETPLSQGHERRSSRLSSVPMFNYQVSINTLRSQGAAAITHGPVSGSTAQRATQRRLHVQMRVHIHIPHDRSGASTRESAYTSTHMSHLPVYETPLSQGRTRAYTSTHMSHPAAPATAPRGLVTEVSQRPRGLVTEVSHIAHVPPSGAGNSAVLSARVSKWTCACTSRPLTASTLCRAPPTPPRRSLPA